MSTTVVKPAQSEPKTAPAKEPPPRSAQSIKSQEQRALLARHRPTLELLDTMPPTNLSAEREAICAVLVCCNTSLLERLDAMDFRDPFHRAIWRLLKGAHDRGLPWQSEACLTELLADDATRVELAKAGDCPARDVVGRLTEIVRDHQPLASSFECRFDWYFRTLRELRLQREARHISTELLQDCHRPDRYDVAAWTRMAIERLQAFLLRLEPEF